MKIYLKVGVYLFFIGGLLVPIGDMIHLYTKTTFYPSDTTTYLGLPLWAYLQFAFATVLMGLPRLKFNQILGAPLFSPWSKEFKTVVFSAFYFLAHYALSGLIPESIGVTKLLVMYGLGFFFWYLADKSWQGLFIALVIAALGTNQEITLVRFGMFGYLPPHDQFHGVPYWLPALYISAATACQSISLWGFKFFSRS